ncbi:MAG: hypothetical protein QG646_3277, partial [Euryarchaeota archaeon]|nr:hypothetical protein [Euryarchaeota archaeon]
MPEPSQREKIRNAWDIYKRQTLSNSIINSMVIRDDELTLVMKENGEIPIAENYGYGLYYHDCRYLSGFLIRLMDMPPTRVLSSDVRGFRSMIMVTNPELKDCTGTTIPKETLLGTLTTVIPGCVRHSHIIQNFNTFPVTLNLTFEFDADFADMFTVRGISPPTAGKVLPARFEGKNLYLSYDGEDKRRRNTIIAFDPLPTRVEGKKCTFELRIAPRSSQTVNIEITVEEIILSQELKSPVKNPDQRMNQITRSYITALECCENIHTSNNIFNSIMVRSMADLNMMRMSLNGDLFHSAGIPWYDTLFGRDSIISALQILPFDTELSKSTLLVNAKFQSNNSDDWRDKDPGKMLHELRLGELANLNQIPHTPYYGTVDATPLFLILLTEYVNWTGDLELFKQLKDNVNRALNWIDVYANMEGNGFAYYAMKSPLGIYNQCWKDSSDSISHSDGTLAKQPIAVAEVQGYVYMAKRQLAPLFRRLGQQSDAVRLEKEAVELKERF